MSVPWTDSTPSSQPPRHLSRHTRRRVEVTHHARIVPAHWFELNTPTGKRYRGVFNEREGDLVGEPRTYTVTDGPPRLIRDKAPVSDDAVVHPALEANASLLLNDELLRSLDFYFDTGSLDGLAQIMELVFGICANRGFTRAELMELVNENHRLYGGYESLRVLMSGGTPQMGT